MLFLMAPCSYRLGIKSCAPESWPLGDRPTIPAVARPLRSLYFVIVLKRYSFMQPSPSSESFMRHTISFES